MRNLNSKRSGSRTKTLGTVLAACVAFASLILVAITHEPKSAVSSPVPAEAAIVPQIAGAKSQSEILLRGKSFTIFRRYVIFGYGGIVTSIKIKEGQAVKAGQILAEYDLDRTALVDIQNILHAGELERTKHEIFNNQVMLDKWKNSHLPIKNMLLKQQKEELENIRELKSKNLAAENAVKNKELQVQTIEKEILDIQDTIKQTEATLKKLKQDLSFLEKSHKRNVELLEWRTKRSYSEKSLPRNKAFLKAPINGHVIWMHPDFRINAKIPTKFHAITVAPLKSMVVRCKVHELELIKLEPGQQGSVIFDALPEKQYSCKISRIPWLSRNPALEVPADYEIECIIEDLDRMIKEGLTCNVKVAITR